VHKASCEGSQCIYFCPSGLADLGKSFFFFFSVQFLKSKCFENWRGKLRNKTSSKERVLPIKSSPDPTDRSSWKHTQKWLWMMQPLGKELIYWHLLLFNAELDAVDLTMNRPKIALGVFTELLEALFSGTCL
jgi:hypothetical protein